MITRSTPATSVTIAPSSPVKRNRWRDWQPGVQLAADSVASTPAAESPKSHDESDPADLAHASAVLNQAGVRMMHLDGVPTIGIWSDLDGPDIRKALRRLGSDQLPVCYLDGTGVPARYKLRRVGGEPVPMNVLTEMERHPDEPWKVRDRMLQEGKWCSIATSWPEWKATALNRLFLERGVTGRPGRITAATVLHGERQQQRRDSILAVSAKSEPAKPTKPPLEKGSL